LLAVQTGDPEHGNATAGTGNQQMETKLTLYGHRSGGRKWIQMNTSTKVLCTHGPGQKRKRKLREAYNLI